ncbi:MAG: hypothetical protein LAT76_13450 [Schleiferiaceae bacterium]|nr:hypothetical protein [Schleiferiaceae bacterium]
MGQLNNYYEILQVPTDASAFKIFTAFRKLYLRDDLDLGKRERILKGYLVLQEESRKFYDLVLRQHKQKSLNVKYLSIVERKEKMALELLEKQTHAPDLLLGPLKKYPLTDSAIELLAWFIGGSLSWIGAGSLALLAAIIMVFFSLSRVEVTVLLLALPILAIGVFMHNYGVLKSKQEKLDAIIAQHC